MSASPNPFNPTSVIRVDVASSGRQRVVVNDVLGRHVRTLVYGIFEAGRRDVVWDGRDDRGARLASGVYLVSLEAHGESVTQRLVLVR